MEVMERRANDDAAWKMGRIMLRYRPIAPKPTAAGAAPGLTVEPIQAVGKAKKREVARRKGGSSGGKRGRKSRKAEDVATRDPPCTVSTAPVVTLPLMPVTPERQETWLMTRASPYLWPVHPVAGVVVSQKPVRAAAVSVTIESVTEVWSVGFRGNTSHDDDLRRWLEADDCPAFVSKAADRVTWTNAAYRRMVLSGYVSAESPSSSSSSYSSTSWSDAASLPEASGDEEVTVVLVTRGLVPGGECRAFTCMTSVRYGCGRRAKVSLAVPCDVWRLEDGSLAWRLDVKAALSLSIGN
ncbi:uncharacterized protein LOC110112773 [Dendrobium catenatum]|uniref:DUF7950 domain-containing protein n=1 Tax=Dendrobium catenatum TaxID=906689 RepID=A0A2I0X5W2_9ASPA|nr:uncharacterized protein LOC110112773 [Dendrobium catenatum]PKU83318.1 hypothetical protein MA16_Dca023603 [Dendrobium catenatum]